MKILVFNYNTPLGKLFVAESKKKHKLYLSDANVTDAREVGDEQFELADAVVFFTRHNGGMEDVIEFKNVEFCAKRAALNRIVCVDEVTPEFDVAIKDYRENDLTTAESFGRASLDALAIGDGITSIVRAFCPLIKTGCAAKAVKAGLAAKTKKLKNREVSVSSPADIIKAIYHALKHTVFFNVACTDPVSYKDLALLAARTAGVKSNAAFTALEPECTASNENMRGVMRVSSTSTAIKAFVSEFIK